MAQRMYATTVANKTAEQLVDTKVALTETESVLQQCKDECERQDRLLGGILVAKGKAKLTNGETWLKISTAKEASGKIQNDIAKVLERVARDKKTSSSPL